MKLVKLPLALLILFVYLQTCFGQEKQAVLYDTFNRIQTGELWGRIDIFVQHLQQNPKSKGYIVIYPQKELAKRYFRGKEDTHNKLTIEFTNLKILMKAVSKLP